MSAPRGGRRKYADHEVPPHLLAIRSMNPEALEAARKAPTVDRLARVKCPQCGATVELGTDLDGRLVAYDAAGRHPHPEAVRPDPSAVAQREAELRAQLLATHHRSIARGGKGVGRPGSLTPEQVADIRTPGVSAKEAAARYGVSVDLIFRIRRGELYRGIEEAA